MTEAIDDAYPLAALQAGMLYHGDFDQRTAAFHDVVTTTVAGRFDQDALRAALAQLTARHPVLRSSIDLTGYSEPVQLVHAAARIPLEVTDWSALPEDEAATRLRDWRDEEQFRGYELAEPPLQRLAAHLLADGRFALSLSFHHVMLDGWSVASLMTELLRRYTAELEGAPLPVAALTETYRDFVAAERAAIDDRDTAAYWRAVIEDAPSGALPRLPGYPVEGPLVSERPALHLAPDLVRRLEAAAGRLRVPLRAVLLAAHLRVMALQTGGDDVVTGVVTHGRPETEAGAEVAGLFLNVLPLRLRLGRESWSALAGRADEAFVGLLPHRRFPLFEVQRLADRSPLFDTLFDFHDFHVYGGLDADGPVRIVGREGNETTDVPFAAIFSRAGDGGLTLVLSHHRTAFPAEQIESIGEGYRAALTAIAADPDGDSWPAEPLLAADLATIAGWNKAAGQGVTVPDGPRTLHGLVAAWAAAAPEAPAVIDGGRTVSYRALWQRSNTLAERLADAGVGSQSVVAVAIARSVETVVATLAVLQAGAAVLPLDVDHPVLRLRELIAEARAETVLTTADRSAEFAESGLTVLVEAREQASSAGDGPRPARDCPPDALAAVLFTSGSTGRPKGVMLTHGAMTDYARWASHYQGLTPGDRFGQRAPMSVDAAFFELAMAFEAGGAAVVMPVEAVVDPDTFVATVNDFGITALCLVPSLITPLVRAEAFRSTPSLGAVMTVGEALTRSLAEEFGAQSGAGLYNAYGPTEAGIGVTECRVRLGEPDAPITIGEPAGGVRLQILDAEGRPVPIGTPGELHVGGAQLARGYLHGPRATAERFIPDHLSDLPGERLYRTGDTCRWLPDGEVEYLGRQDAQVKIRGVRIEPAEIEARLAEHPRVARAVVLVQRDEDRRRERLVAYLAWSGEREGVTSELRRFCADRLPPAMVPGHFELVDEIPLLANGKVNRKALPAPSGGGTEREGFAAPRDLVEAKLAALWEEVLEQRSVGIRDDFFDLGGHSLRALRLAALIRREFDAEVPVSMLMTHSTVERLAVALRTPELLAPRTEVVPFREQGSRIPIFFIHALGGQVFRYRKLSMLLGEDQPAYGIPAGGFDDDEAPRASVEEMADEYARRIRALRPEGPVIVSGFCIGGNLALEVARRVRAQGTPVPLVAPFWSHAVGPTAPEIDDDVALMVAAVTRDGFDVDRAKLAGLSAEEQLAEIVRGAADAGSLNPAAMDLGQAGRLLKVFRANATALRGYGHERYDGDVLLLKPSGDEFAPDDDFGWPETVAGALEVAWIPGTRADTAEEPNVFGTADVFRKVLDRVNSDH
jgi:amino acid adenylation domain-containing protein